MKTVRRHIRILPELRRIACTAAVFVAGVLFVARAGTTTEDLPRGLEAEVSILPAAGAHIPVGVTILNRGAERTVEVRITADNAYSSENISVARRVLRLAPGQMSFELPLRLPCLTSSITVDFYLDGVRLSGMQSRQNVSPDDRNLILTAGSSQAIARFDEAADAWNGLQPNDVTRLTVRNLPADELLRGTWQAYAGLQASILIEAKDVPGLSAARREALNRWIMYGGGTLWLLHDAPGEFDAAAAALRLPMPPGQNTLISCGTGTCIRTRVTAQADITVFMTAKSSAKNLLNKNDAPPFQSLYHLATNVEHYGRGAPDNRQSFGDLFAMLHVVPRGGFVLLSIVFAILVGPVNFFVLRRVRRMALFYVTAPLIALVGIGIIACYAVIRDGWSIRGNETALLLHDAATGGGAIYQARGIFSAYTPDALHYPPETAAVPFIPYSSGSTRSNNSYWTDWTGDQSLSAGWVSGRTENGILTVTPVRVRMGLDILPDGRGGFTATNQLPGTVTMLTVRTAPDIYYGAANPINPGRTVTLMRIPKSDLLTAKHRPEESLIPQARRDKNLRPWFYDAAGLSQAAVFAETTDLPYLNDGGLAIARLSGRYAYVMMTATGCLPAAGFHVSP